MFNSGEHTLASGAGRAGSIGTIGMCVGDALLAGASHGNRSKLAPAKILAPGTRVCTGSLVPGFLVPESGTGTPIGIF